MIYFESIYSTKSQFLTSSRGDTWSSNFSGSKINVVIKLQFFLSWLSLRVIFLLIKTIAPLYKALNFSPISPVHFLLHPNKSLPQFHFISQLTTCLGEWTGRDLDMRGKYFYAEGMDITRFKLIHGRASSLTRVEKS